MTTPAATVLAAKIRASRSSPCCRRPASRPGGRLGIGAPARRAGVSRAGQPPEGGQRTERGRGGQGDDDRVPVVTGEPDTRRQGQDTGQGRHDSVQAESLTTPLRREEHGRERAQDHGAEAEAEPADDADRRDDDQRAAGQQGQGRYPHQDQSGDD